jgi:hypothetical protein
MSIPPELTFTLRGHHEASYPSRWPFPWSCCRALSTLPCHSSGADGERRRGTQDKNTHHENDLFNQASGPSGIGQTLKAYLFALGDTWTITPNIVLQTNYGFAYQKNFQIPQNYTGFKASDYGFTNLDSQQQLPGLPFIGISGYANLSYATNTNRWEHYSHFLESTAVWQRGEHTLTFGYDGRLILEHQQSAGNGLGSLSFDTTLTNGPNVTSSAASNQSQFDAFGAFLLGDFTNATLSRQVLPAYDSWYHALYVQGDWRANSKLTMNFGLRYDIETGYAERYNRWADLDLTAANPLSTPSLPFTGGARYLGSDFPNRTWKTFHNKFAPRITPAHVHSSCRAQILLPRVMCIIAWAVRVRRRPIWTQQRSVKLRLSS